MWFVGGVGGFLSYGPRRATSFLTPPPHTHTPTKQTREYALVSGTDPLLKEDTQRLESLDPELPRCLAALAGEGDLQDFIHVRVVRPSGPTHSIIDFPGARFCVFFCLCCFLFCCLVWEVWGCGATPCVVGGE